MSLEEWKKVIDINLTSTFLMSKSAIKKMLKNKSGKIVNITSVVGHTGNLGQANYTCLLYTSPSPRDKRQSRMPSSA